MLGGSTYYTFVDSGAFTVNYASFTFMDESGIHLLNSGPFSILNSTFDYSGSGQVSTSTLFTLQNVTNSTITVYGVTFSSTSSNNKYNYNYNIIGSSTGLSWTQQAYTGLLVGAANTQDDATQKHILWAPAGCSAFSSIATGNWSSTSTWNSGIVPTSCNATSITNATNVTADVSIGISTLTVVLGSTFTLNGNQLAISSFTNRGSFVLLGTETVTPQPTNVTASSVTYNATSGSSLVYSSWTYSNLIVKGPSAATFSLTASSLTVNQSLSITSGTFTTTGSNYPIAVSSDVVINGGTFNLNASTLTLGHTWKMTSGSFIAGTSTVTLAAPVGSTNTLTGNTSFYNLIGCNGRQLDRHAGQFDHHSSRRSDTYRRGGQSHQCAFVHEWDVRISLQRRDQHRHLRQCPGQQCLQPDDCGCGRREQLAQRQLVFWHYGECSFRRHVHNSSRLDQSDGLYRL